MSDTSRFFDKRNYYSGFVAPEQAGKLIQAATNIGLEFAKFTMRGELPDTNNTAITVVIRDLRSRKRFVKQITGQ